MRWREMEEYKRMDWGLVVRREDSMHVHLLECRVCPEVWVTTRTPSHPPTHPTAAFPTHPPASHHQEHQSESPPNVALLTPYWPSEDSVSRVTGSWLLPPPSPTHPSPPPPTLPRTDHVTFRKASPSSPLLLLTLSQPERSQRPLAAGCLEPCSPLRGFKGNAV